MIRIVMDIQNEDKQKESSIAVAIAKSGYQILEDYGFVGCTVSVKEIPERNTREIDIPSFLVPTAKGKMERQHMNGGGEDGTGND